MEKQDEYEGYYAVKCTCDADCTWWHVWMKDGKDYDTVLPQYVLPMTLKTAEKLAAHISRDHGGDWGKIVPWRTFVRDRVLQEIRNSGEQS